MNHGSSGHLPVSSSKGDTRMLVPSRAAGRNPNHNDSGMFNVRDILYTIFKHKRKVILLTLLLLFLTGVAYYFLKGPPRYKAYAVLMVKSGRDYSASNLDGDSSPLRIGLYEILSTETAILKSKELIDETIRTIGAVKIYPDITRFESRNIDINSIAEILFRKDFNVDASKNSNLIGVSFNNVNPYTAAAVVNKIIDLYIEKRIGVLTDSKPTIFLEKKVGELKERLADKENEVQSYKQKHKLYSIEDQRDILFKQRDALEAGYMTTQSQLKELQEKLSILETGIAQFPKMIPFDHQSRSYMQSYAEQQLLGLRQKEQELLMRYREGNPLVAQVRNQIRLLEDYMSKNTGEDKIITNDVPNQAYIDIQKEIMTTRAELNAARIRYGELGDQLRSQDKAIKDFAAVEQPYRQLLHELDTNQQQYETWQQKLEETRASDILNAKYLTSINIIERASPPMIPIQTKRKTSMLIVAAVLFSVGSGLGLAFVLEALGQGFTSPEKAEKLLELQALTSIGYKKQ